MLDAFIIERIRRRQEEQRRSEGIPLRLPLQHEQDIPEKHTPERRSGNPVSSGNSRTWRDSSPESVLENVLENSSLTSTFSNTDYSI